MTSPPPPPYPGAQPGYPDPSGGYSAQQSYPQQQGLPGQQGYPNQQGFPGQQGYPGQQGAFPYQGQPGRQPPGAWNAGPQFGQPGGAPMGSPAPKKTGLVIGIVVAAVLVVGGGVTAFLLLSGDSGSDKEQVTELADKAVTAFNARDVDALNDVSCGTIEGDPSNVPAGVKMERRGQPTINSDTATIPVTLSDSSHSEESKIRARKQGGEWCLEVS